MAPVITMLHDAFHHNAPRPLSPQCPMMPAITMLNGFCYHNAPGPVSSQYSIPLVTTVHNETSHYNAPWHLSSQCSKTAVNTMPNDACHHKSPGPLLPKFFCFPQVALGYVFKSICVKGGKRFPPRATIISYQIGSRHFQWPHLYFISLFYSLYQ